MNVISTDSKFQIATCPSYDPDTSLHPSYEKSIVLTISWCFKLNFKSPERESHIFSIRLFDNEAIYKPLGEKSTLFI